MGSASFGNNRRISIMGVCLCVCMGGRRGRGRMRRLYTWSVNREQYITQNKPVGKIWKLFKYIGDTCIINYTLYNSISLKRWLEIKRRRIHTRMRRFVVWSSTDKEFQRARSIILIHSLTNTTTKIYTHTHTHARARSLAPSQTRATQYGRLHKLRVFPHLLN